jgi:hypothetical protein
VCLGLNYSECKAHALHYTVIWPVWKYLVFPHFLINSTIFEKKFLEYNFFKFSLPLFYETYRIVGNIWWDITNVQRSSCTVSVILSEFNKTWILLQIFEKYTNINIDKILQVGAEFFHTVGHTHTHSETDMTRLIVAFLNFGKAPNKGSYPSISVTKIYFLRLLDLSRQNILYVIHAKYFGIIFGRKFAWRYFQKNRSQDLQGPPFRKWEIIISIKLTLSLCRPTLAFVWKFVVYT